MCILFLVLGGHELIKTRHNIVRTYDEERTICDVIKHRDKYDGETFIKAIKFYIRTSNNQSKLFKYASELGIERKVYEVIEVVANTD